MGVLIFTIMNTTVKILICIVFLSSCKKEEIKIKGIEFYLLEDDLSFKNKLCKDFDFISQNLQANSIITNDVISYNWTSHTMTLSESAYNKLKSYRDKTLPIYPIVLTINGERIYGLFYKYAILSSGCQSTLLSETDFEPKNGKMECIIVHGQGYDSTKLGKDPRGDKRIYDYLKSTGRLIE
jgi:hypothetical protein